MNPLDCYPYIALTYQTLFTLTGVHMADMALDLMMIPLDRSPYITPLILASRCVHGRYGPCTGDISLRGHLHGPRLLLPPTLHLSHRKPIAQVSE